MLMMVASVALEGCALTLVPHAANIDSIGALREGSMAPVSVGDFTVGKSVAPSAGQKLSVRAHPLQTSNGTSFAQYLKDALTTDLQAAGKFDAAAPRVIAGELTENSLNAAGISEANAALGARFRVTQADRTLFDKELRVQATWESGFIGALAIPAAVDHYTDQYTQLLNQLYRDGDFRKACSMPAISATN